MAYHGSVQFDTIVVVESLRPPDPRTGTAIFESTIAPAALRESFVAELHEPNDRNSFFSVLRHLRQLGESGHSPILHLEAHGSIEGLLLVSGERILWEEFSHELAAINQATRMNLLVVAAACQGFHLTSVLRPVARSPAWAIVGPPDVIHAGPLYDACKAFYTAFISNYDLWAALRAMNNHTPVSDWEYRFLPAEVLLCHVYSAYMHGVGDGETHDQRVNRLVTEIARVQSLTVDQTMRLRVEVSAHLNDHSWWFEHYKERFLMLDLFPENRGRFPMTFEECRRLTAQRPEGG